MGQFARGPVPLVIQHYQTLQVCGLKYKHVRTRKDFATIFGLHPARCWFQIFGLISMFGNNFFPVISKFIKVISAIASIFWSF